MTSQDYQVSKVDLGKGSREFDMKNFKFSNKKIVDWVWKDAKDKQNMKQTMKSMAQYINAILHPEPKPLHEMSATIDVRSPINQHSLDNLVHRSKEVAKTFKEWIQFVQDEPIKQINLLNEAKNETTNVTKKIESNINSHEKEKANQVKEVSQMDEVQEYGLQKFLIK